MKTMRFFILLGVVSAGLDAAPALAEPAPANDALTQCDALQSADFSGIPDAPTQILSAKWVKAEKNTPDYCEVSGYVAPQVGFEMRLPVAGWNGRFLELGCGGHCGRVDVFIVACPLLRGYACIASDAGHRGTGIDGLWGYGNWQAKVDWGYRAPHVTALVGKAIIERYYHAAPRKSYFIGASTGGRQALQEAQRFPWDFDGIIAIAPPTDLSAIYMTFAWSWRVTHDEDGQPLLGKAEFKLLTDSAIEKCDLDDGVKDGIISDPLHCAFNPATLACTSNQSSGCLSPIQVDAVNKVYAGPMTSSGVKLSLGGPVVGSELGGALEGWETTYDSAGPTAFEISEGLRYLFFLPELGPAWKLSDFNFDRDYKRLRTMQSLYDSNNPNLRSFKAAGGKLMILQGLNDNVVHPRSTIDYYEMMERTMGGRTETQSFARLFLVPGAEHFLTGVGAGYIDSLGALQAWVEEGKTPDRLIAAHLKDNIFPDLGDFPLDIRRIQFTRPVFPYPLRAKYGGRGDPNDAANFGPIGR